MLLPVVNIVFKLH